MRFRAFVVSLVVVMLPVSPRLVWAYKEGQAGYSGKFGGPSCSLCHNGGSTPIVSLTGNTTLPLGGTGMYTFTVTSTDPSKQIAAGFDASATDSAGADSGTLIAEAAQDDQLCEAFLTPPMLCPGSPPLTDVTHTSPGKANDANGRASWIFQWKAPATKGNYAIWAAGNSVNGDGAANIAFNGTPAIPGDASAHDYLKSRPDQHVNTAIDSNRLRSFDIHPDAGGDVDSDADSQCANGHPFGTNGDRFCSLIAAANGYGHRHPGFDPARHAGRRQL